MNKDTPMNFTSTQAPPSFDEIEYNLSLTVEQRLTQHQQALDLVLEIEKQRGNIERQFKSAFADSASS